MACIVQVTSAAAVAADDNDDDVIHKKKKIKYVVCFSEYRSSFPLC